MSILNYLKETRAEFDHINWPTRNQTIAYTIVITVVTLVVAYYLGLFDWLFSLALEEIIL